MSYRPSLGCDPPEPQAITLRIALSIPAPRFRLARQDSWFALVSTRLLSLTKIPCHGQGEQNMRFSQQERHDFSRHNTRHYASPDPFGADGAPAAGMTPGGRDPFSRGTQPAGSGRQGCKPALAGGGGGRVAKEKPCRGSESRHVRLLQKDAIDPWSVFAVEGYRERVLRQCLVEAPVPRAGK